MVDPSGSGRGALLTELIADGTKQFSSGVHSNADGRLPTRRSDDLVSHGKAMRMTRDRSV